MLLSLLGVLMRGRAKLARDAKWVLWGVLVGAVSYSVALLDSEGMGVASATGLGLVDSHGRSGLAGLRARWGVVARRLEEAVALFLQSASGDIELGNTYVRLGEGPAAIVEFRRPLEEGTGGFAHPGADRGSGLR
jgi:hypothetical protein